MTRQQGFRPFHPTMNEVRKKKKVFFKCYCCNEKNNLIPWKIGSKVRPLCPMCLPYYNGEKE